VTCIAAASIIAKVGTSYWMFIVAAAAVVAIECSMLRTCWY
jgi:hypothetical protein